jgi:multidrug efflux pump subunit AcrB
MSDQINTSLRVVTGPQVITRYNNYRSVTIDGSPAPGVASGHGARGHGRGLVDLHPLVPARM